MPTASRWPETPPGVETRVEDLLAAVWPTVTKGDDGVGPLAARWLQKPPSLLASPSSPMSPQLSLKMSHHRRRYPPPHRRLREKSRLVSPNSVCLPTPVSPRISPCASGKPKSSNNKGEKNNNNNNNNNNKNYNHSNNNNNNSNNNNKMFRQPTITNRQLL